MNRGRPPKNKSELQTQKIVVYVTNETKEALQTLVTQTDSSESKLGDIAIRQLLASVNGGNSMQYTNLSNGASLTGPLQGADVLYQSPVDIRFNCEMNDQSWEGQIRWVVSHGSHVEFNVQAHGSGFNVIAGKTVNGWFLSIPSEEVCFDLAAPRDTFYNEEKVMRSSHGNRIDGISAVQALKALSEAGYLVLDK